MCAARERPCIRRTSGFRNKGGLDHTRTMKTPTLLAAALALATSAAVAEIKTQIVEYKDGDQALQGLVAFDDASDKTRPGVLLIHDWMGVSDYAESRAKQLAELGYVAFCADIYGKGVRPADGKEAAALAGKYKADRALFRSRLKAGLDELKAQKLVNKDEIASIGYCFGGTGVLELARSGADIQGVVSFHGNLGSPTPADAKNIKCPVLVLHGADDPFVPPKEVAEFKDEMKSADVQYEFIAYPGAVHSFTKPAAGDDNSTGAAYNEAADKKSWEEMKQFFGKIFAKK
jgi:dienelactone hydrolase